MPAPASSSPAAVRPGRNLLGALAAGVGLAALLLLLPHSPRDGYDWVHMQVFYKEYYRAAVLAGHLPQWDPWVGLGRPFLADVETATLYPPNLVYLAGPGAGLAATLALHLALAIWGVRVFARQLGCRDLTAWFAALGFALGAPLLGRLQSGQVQVFCALCWLPATFAALQVLLAAPGRRPAAALAVALALFFLAGSPPMFWVGGWGLAAYFGLTQAARGAAAEWRRTTGWLAVAAVLAAGLAAAASLPFLELAAEGNRSGLAPEFALQHPLEAGSWWSLLTSRPPGRFYYWEFNLYAGLPLVLLAALAVRCWRAPGVRPLLILGLGFAVLALGPAGGVLPWLVAHVPGFGSFRYPSRYALVLAFALGLLAALALEHGLRAIEARRPGWARAAAFAVGALLLLNAADNLRALIERSAVYAGPVLALREEAVAAVLRDRLGGNQPPPRVLAPPWLVREDSGLRHGYATVSSFANPMLARVWDTVHAALGAAPGAFDRVNLPLATYAAPPETFRVLDLAARWDPAREDFVLAPAAAGARAWVATATETVPDSQAAASRLAAGHGFREVALLESPVASRSGDPADGAKARATIVSFAPERIVVDCTAPVAAQLVLAEPWYPGWTARVDGAPAEVRPANAWMRAVAVPAGGHRVEFTFHSRWLPWGAGLSLAALGLAGVLWFRR